MEKHQRHKRHDPERTGPHRHFSMMYQHPGDGAKTTAERPEPVKPSPAGGIGETVASGVRLAYRVIEEQIHVGQRVAQQINERSYGSGAMAGDFREITERTLRTWMELGTLWFEMLGSLTGAVRPAQHGGGAETPGTHAGAGLSLDVTSTQPVQVTLDLHPHVHGVHLIVYELHTPSRTCPPLADVHLEAAQDGRPAKLRLRVPPGQPAGQYSGVVVDGAGVVRGTLTVRVGEPSSDSQTSS